jgi:three-Cys-motif partner protein
MMDDAQVIASDGLPARRSGEWAKRKHHFLRNYCGITTTSMRKKWRLVYVDVMAGPGLCKILETGEEFPGSPLVAMDHDFAEYHFFEDDAACADALDKHAKAGRVRIHSENWTAAALSGVLAFDDRTLVVAFIDPTGISQVPMKAIRALSRNARIDMLVTIQYRLGIVWNAPQYQNASVETETALDAFLDSRDWRDWKAKDPTEFGRKAVEHFEQRLQSEGFIGTRHISVPESQPLYRFTLFSRHPRAEDFWLKILKTDEKGQRELDL